MTTARAPRVAIVGVRRVRTGLGQFFAKHLVAAGAEVPAFIASRKETIEEGRWSLRQVGVDAEGYVDLDALLDAHPTVDALVIASPHATHRAWLDAAVARRLHVLCEKPLLWGGEDDVRDSISLTSLALDRGLVVFENCPWPYALPAFDQLHPTARQGGVGAFEMEMAPTSTIGRDMLVDAVSHPISVLQALAPPGKAFRTPTPRLVEWTAAEVGRLEFTFEFDEVGAAGPMPATIRLKSVPAQPRPMALVVNGFRAERRVRMDDYSLSFVDGGRSVPLPDPMASLVGDFVQAIWRGEVADAAVQRVRRINRRLAMVREIVGSFPGP